MLRFSFVAEKVILDELGDINTQVQIAYMRQKWHQIRKQALLPQAVCVKLYNHVSTYISPLNEPFC